MESTAFLLQVESKEKFNAFPKNKANTKKTPNKQKPTKTSLDRVLMVV